MTEKKELGIAVLDFSDFEFSPLADRLVCELGSEEIQRDIIDLVNLRATPVDIFLRRSDRHPLSYAVAWKEYVDALVAFAWEFVEEMRKGAKFEN